MNSWRYSKRVANRGLMPTQLDAGLIALLGLLAATGCDHGRSTIRNADLRPLPYVGEWPNRFDGIKNRLKEQRSPADPIRLIVVHGMRTHERGYSDSLQRRIAKLLKLSTDKKRDTTTIHIVRNYSFVVTHGRQQFGQAKPLESEIRKTTWHRSAGRAKDTTLIVYEVFWAPFRDVIKNGFLGCLESRSVREEFKCNEWVPPKYRNQDSRQLLNGRAKDELLVDGFGDATMVMGPLGEIMQDDIDLAMCIVATDVIRPEALMSLNTNRCELAENAGLIGDSRKLRQLLASRDVFVVTESLGSFLLLDGQQRAAVKRVEDSASISGFSLLDSATVYMFANQVSLLGLARLSYCKRSENECAAAPDSSTPAFLQLTQGSKDTLGIQTKYLAFNDVDDLLTFEIPPYIAKSDFLGPIVNISVQNPTWAIPGLLKNPKTHTLYWKNPAAVRAIVYGLTIPAPKGEGRSGQ